MPDRPHEFAADMMLYLPLALAVLLFACGPWDNRDLWGNVYPPQCTREAFEAIQLPIVNVNLLDVDLPHHRRWLAACINCNTDAGSIIIDPRLNKYERASAIDHEKCHRIMALNGLPMDWHP